VGEYAFLVADRYLIRSSLGSSQAEAMKNALRGRELGVESMEKDVFRREKDVEGTEERLRGREDVLEGKERSIMVRIDESERRREGEQEKLREEREDCVRRVVEVEGRERDVGAKELGVAERER
jgi:hypothetical protein